MINYKIMTTTLLTNWLQITLAIGYKEMTTTIAQQLIKAYHNSLSTTTNRTLTTKNEMNNDRGRSSISYK